MQLPAFAPLGRWLGVLNSLAMPSIAMWQILTSISDTDVLALGSYTVCLGMLVRGWIHHTDTGGAGRRGREGRRGGGGCGALGRGAG